MKGFWIYAIEARGRDKETAVVKLKKGANIITGPSDTGKSHLFSIINYALGRSAVPDDIPESYGYDSYVLKIVTFEKDDKFILHRKKGENQISVWSTKSFETDNKPELIDKYSTTSNLSNENNISHFLLDLCGLKDSILLKNRTKGTKISLSFKNINQFTSIAEDRIITKSTPFYFTQNNSNHILEQSMLSLILEGEDFSKAKLIEDPVKKETRINGKLEFIEQQILRYASEREKTVLAAEKMSANLTSLDQIFINQKLDEKLNTLYEYEESITEVGLRINELTEKKIYYSELIKRFKILERQYLSDLERLDFISEAESLSSQLPDSVCPICSNPINKETIHHISEIENFRDSVLIEKQFVIDKINDLKVSISENEINLKEQEVSLLDLNNSHRLLKERLDKIQPEIENLKEMLNSILAFEKINNRINFFDTESQELYDQKNRFEQIKREKESTDIVNVCDYEILKTLGEYIEQRLIAWNYNSNPNVIFNSSFKFFDITISGKNRGSYGKGRRSLSYTACLLGFLDFCLDENKLFSNLLIFDSPLTTFRDKDDIPEQEIEGLEELFFKDIANTSNQSQIIILENKIPDSNIDINRIEFTRDENLGRYGFYPAANEIRPITIDDDGITPTS